MVANCIVKKIFTDQQTGKNFDRPRYLIMKEDVLRHGDTLIISEIDRLGRNKEDTLKELRYYKERGEWSDYGRPRAIDFAVFKEEYKKVVAGEMKPFECIRALGMTKPTLYKYKKLFEKDDN